jgi:spermidine synthase
MTHKYLTWLRFLVFATAGVYCCALLSAVSLMNFLPTWQIILCGIGLALCIFAGNRYTRPINSEQATAILDRETRRQTNFIEQLPIKAILPAIFASAALSLLLELAMIRWQSSAIDFLAFFKNFGLFACFAGLGLGYSLSHNRLIPLVCSNFLVCWQVLFVTALQASFISHVISKPPVLEQVSIGATLVANTSAAAYWLAVYSILAFLFCLTALSFVPVGQLCGRLMSRTEALPAYGANLLGSLFGVIFMTALSYFWTPPFVWMGVCLVGCLLFSAYNARTVATSALISFLALIVLGMPEKFAGSVVHSPYQIIELEIGKHGWPEIKAAGYYYQRVVDLTKQSCTAFPDLQPMADYYNLPYKFAPAAKQVLIMGAGAGNDVSAALRAGAEHVDAVEIDPAIAEFGRLYHPEKPYDDKRVNLILGDARAFLRNTHSKYDVIVYALIDSHALSSSSSSLRVDSYIYTVESFRDARTHLNPNGLLALSFVGVVKDLQQKVYFMLKKAFDEKDPLVLCSNYDSSSSFFENDSGPVLIPPEIEKSKNLFRQTDFGLVNHSIDLSTDDWPFFYMPRRQFPFSYLPLVGLVLLLSYALVSSLNQSKLRLDYLPFFWLGAGFMLVETKAITELGLQFGNTWLVTAIVVGSVMSMAFISNLAVGKFRLKNLPVPAVLLIASLVASALVSHNGGYGVNLNEWEMTAVITCPIVFSGIIFSVLISKIDDIGSAIALNILGALFGGVLEYCAMYLGYRALYGFAIVIYLLSFVAIAKKSSPVETKLTP